jgi:hypothetical protein
MKLSTLKALGAKNLLKLNGIIKKVRLQSVSSGNMGVLGQYELVLFVPL